ncbi:hypothetical protein S40288_08712 [Stachybotrys chartarum IBT 40288]|nr:hypothetical protein S40288_08712 [Stachybotrys chartarum IBT 40288]
MTFHPTLDHIVILVSESTLAQLPAKLKDDFLFSPGGAHADGLTHNRLILLQDGVYIELIAFFDNSDPEKRKNHRWGQLKENTIVDWAHTLNQESDFAAVRRRVNGGQGVYAYTDLIPGGRRRPDGVELEWAISAATFAHDGNLVPGELPFWCLDRTPRHLRVPYQETQQTQHPSGVKGVSKVAVRVAEDQYVSVKQVYDSIHDERGAWHYVVPGKAKAEHRVEITAASRGQNAPHITITLAGGSRSSIEVLPGLVFEVEPEV